MTKTKAVIALKRASIFARLWKDEAGQDLVEYALIAGFIGCGTVAGFINTVANGFSGDINGAI